ncbi:MAG: hypothetical protein LBJ18_00160 [Rickettsiales bacterium]|jgi:putative addiction module killer protein|nr:hypothetical protein [Rickettsiales bacterium]
MNIRQTDEFAKWFRKLRDEMAKAVIVRRIRIIESENHFGDSKSVGNGIF